MLVRKIIKEELAALSEDYKDERRRRLFTKKPTSTWKI